MAQNIYANARSIVHKVSGGKSIAAFPDVCLTPPAGSGMPVPIPYANQLDAQAAAGDKKAKKDQKKLMDDAAKNGYKVKSVTQWAIKTSGDEAGRLGGILTSQTMQKAEFVNYSMDVKFEGKKVVHMGDPLFHNKKNIVG